MIFKNASVAILELSNAKVKKSPDEPYISYDEFQRAVETVSSEFDVVIVDFGKMRYFNSTGVAILVKAIDTLQEKGKKIFFSNIPTTFQVLFQMLGIAPFFEDIVLKNGLSGIAVEKQTVISVTIEYDPYYA